MCNVIRILYLILFYLIYRITDIVLLVVMLIQTGLNIFTGEPSVSIKTFGKGLGIYLKQISEFLSYASDEKPYPFSDWPEVSPINMSESDKTDSDLSPAPGSEEGVQVKQNTLEDDSKQTKAEKNS